jgi:hypothetical protein
LEFFTTNSFKMGMAQAGILASQIRAVYAVQLKAIAEQTKNAPSLSSLRERVKHLKLPDNYRMELKGILFGLRADPAADAKSFSMEDLLLIHDCARIESLSVKAVHPPQELLFTRKHPIDAPMSGFPQRIEMQTYPGLIGTISASNDWRLSIQLEGSGSTAFPQGIPSTLYARQTLERCRSLDDVDWDIYGVQDPDYKPASSHTLVVSDHTGTAYYAFYGDASHDYVKV